MKQFWGYLHSNGKIQVKRWLGDHGDYTNNPFVIHVVKPFEADNWEEAANHVKQVIYESTRVPQSIGKNGV